MQLDKICVSFLIASIIWIVSGGEVYSLSAIAAAALLMLGMAMLCPVQSFYNSRVFIAQVMLLCGILAIALIQFLNYRGVFFQDTSFSYIVPSFHINWLPSTIIYKNSILLFVALSASIASYIAASILFCREPIGVFALKFFAANAFAFSLLGWYQIENNIEIPYGYFLTQSNSFSTMYYENAASVFVYMGIAAAFALFIRNPKRLNLIWIAAALVEFYILCKTDARAGKIIAGGIIFAGFAFILLSIKSAKTRLWAILLLSLTVIACIIAFLYSDIGCHSLEIGKSEIAKRLSVQSNAFEVIKNREINGIGLGAYMYEELPIVSKKAQLLLKPLLISVHPHCDILEYAVEFGIVGMLFLFAAVILFFLQLWHNKKALGIVNVFMALSTFAMFAHSCIDIFLHVTSTMVLFSLALAWVKSPLGGQR